MAPSRAKWVGMTCGAPLCGSLTASCTKSCPASQSRHWVSLMAASQGWISVCVFSRRCQAVGPEGGECVDDEDGVRGGGRDSGSGALPPVPLAAGDAGVVTPDHLAWLGVLDCRLALRHRVEVLVAGGPDQPGRALVVVQVLAA